MAAAAGGAGDLRHGAPPRRAPLQVHQVRECCLTSHVVIDEDGPSLWKVFPARRFAAQAQLKQSAVSARTTAGTVAPPVATPLGSHTCAHEHDAFGSVSVALGYIPD